MTTNEIKAAVKTMAQGKSEITAVVTRLTDDSFELKVDGELVTVMDRAVAETMPTVYRALKRAKITVNKMYWHVAV